MSSSLPPRPNYEQLRKQAKDLHKACMSGAAAAVERMRTYHPNFTNGSTIAAATLADAQLAVAHQHGFGSWPRLKRAIDEIEAVEVEVKALRAEFAALDEAGRQRLLQGVHDRRRFVDYQDGDAQLSDGDARLVVANRHDYALWSKYDSYVYLDPAVKDVIVAVRKGDLEGLRNVLREVPAAANPRWVSGYEARESERDPGMPNDSIPLFCVCEGGFRGTNQQGNEGELARALLEAGADAASILADVAAEPSFDDPQAVVQKAFQVAVLHGRTEVVRFLLEKDVDVNGKTGVEYHGAQWAYLDEPEWAYLEKDEVFDEIWGPVLKHAQARRKNKNK